MKRTNLFLILVCMSLQACAVNYSQISALKSVGDSVIENEDLVVTIAIQPFGNNGRYRDRAIKNNIAFLYLSIKNKMNTSINVEYEDINVSVGNQLIPPIEPGECTKTLKLSRWVYWLYALFWGGSRGYDSKGDRHNVFIPFGLPIAIYNFVKATSTNNKMADDLTTNAFQSGEIGADKTNSGLVYLPRLPAQETSVRVRYLTRNDGARTIEIPFPRFAYP